MLPETRHASESGCHRTHHFIGLRLFLTLAVLSRSSFAMDGRLPTNLTVGWILYQIGK